MPMMRHHCRSCTYSASCSSLSKTGHEQIAELSMLCGFDDGLAVQQHRPATASAACWPRYIRLWRRSRPATGSSSSTWSSPAISPPEKLALLGEKKLATRLCKLRPIWENALLQISPRHWHGKTHRPRYECCCRCSPTPSTPALTLRKQRDEVALEVEQRVLATLFTRSWPAWPESVSGPQPDPHRGCLSDLRLCRTSYCLCSLAPVTRRSGSSIRGEHPSRRAINASNGRGSCPPSPRSEIDIQGLLHTQNEPGETTQPDVIALARRRCDVLFAMMRDGTFIPRRCNKHAWQLNRGTPQCLPSPVIITLIL